MSEFPADDPSVVWHYTDGPGLLSILRNHVLWATAAPFLNDAGEVALGLDLITRRLTERLADHADAESLRQAIQQSRHRLDDSSGGTFFILSASQHWDSLAMWRDYGGARESYALGLDATEPLLVVGDPEGHPEVDGAQDDGFVLRQRPWAPVEYDDAGQQTMIDDLLDSIPGAISRAEAMLADQERPTPESFTDLLDQLEMALILTKHAGFRDERETRLATILYTDRDTQRQGPSSAQRTSTFVRYRSSAFGIAPYLWLTGAGDDPRPGVVGTTTPRPLPLRGLALSPSPNGPAAEGSVHSLLLASGYGDLPVRRSAIPFRG